MRLLYNWKDILKKAWSMRFMALAALSAGASLFLTVLPQIIEVDILTLSALSLLTIVFTFAGMWSRLVDQKGTHVN